MTGENDINYFILDKSKSNDSLSNTKVTDRVVALPKSNQEFTLVDVFQHKIFANTSSEALRNKLPFIFIEEYSLISNSLINQFRYFGDILNLKSITDASSRQIENITSSSLDSIVNFVKNVAGVNLSLPDLTPNLDKIKSNYIPTLTQESTFNEQLLGPSLKPYDGLYQTKKTGFRYIMPYFDDKNYDINNKFADNFSGFMGVETQPLKFAPNIFKMGADMVKNTGEAFLGFSPGAYSSPSTYVEIPQYFTAGEYETYTVKFDLLNTFNFEDIQKNYDLLFLLAFQNLPYREDIAKIVPPKLYTLLIPGQIFLPYCHMKSIKVDYVGNRRQLKNIKKYSYTSNGLIKQEQNIIIPDCYRVTIEFLSMVKPASNFMLVPDIQVTEQTALITAAETTRNGTP